MAFGGAAAVIIFGFLLAAVRAAEPKMAEKSDSGHASIKAYPGSVVSLKDPASGMMFYVESNGRRLVAFDKEGSIKWSIDVFDAGKFTPGTGAVVVRQLSLRDGHLWLTCGKHAYAEADPQTGKVKFFGED
jgi:outer membrane protein assembly factor BamB